MALKRARIKICGMTRKEDITHAAFLGVDAIGLIFHEKSPRYLSLEQAKPLCQNVQIFMNIVAVVVNPTQSFLSHILDHLPIQMLQFHGDEPAEFCRQFHLPYMKAIRAPSQEAVLMAMEHYPDAAGILLDTPGVEGGSGLTFDWKIVPKKRSHQLILAGGLTAENVKTAIQICAPDAVDVSSGVESKPGIKDHEKMTAFVQACGACYDD